MKNIKEIIENKNKELKELFKHTISVSKLNNEYIKEKFDELKEAEQCYLKGLENPYYKYAGMSVNEILDQWHDKANTSKHYGNLLDEFTGLYLTNDDKLYDWKIENNFDTDERLRFACLGITQFYDYILNHTNYHFVARELPVYYETDEGYKINGRFDCLFYDENTDSYIIIDWKTTENITTKNYYHKYLQGPANMFQDCDMNLYTIQLHIYKLALIYTYKLAPANRISVYVCNLLRKEHNNLYYKLFGQNFDFNEQLLNSFIKYGNLMSKNNI